MRNAMAVRTEDFEVLKTGLVVCRHVGDSDFGMVNLEDRLSCARGVM